MPASAGYQEHLHSQHPTCSRKLPPGQRQSFPQRQPQFPTLTISRGPPRKPKQSQWAVWVGNLSPSTTIVQLKDHFSPIAPDDIESVFLITKTQCAYVNYSTEAACLEAIRLFDTTVFRGNRLVCRIRRNLLNAQTNNAATAPSHPDVPHLSHGDSDRSIRASRPSKEADEAPLIVSSPPCPSKADSPDNKFPTEELPTGALDRLNLAPRSKDRYFILKSLTLDDLLLSTRNGLWTTQPHNEAKLNDAFDTAENVYLIFSANKSGYYFGCARMKGPIVEGQPSASSTQPVGFSMPECSAAMSATTTPATATAPRGRIVDDSTRGKIFWEAVRDDDEDENVSRMHDQDVEGADLPASLTSPSIRDGHFAVEWLSTVPVPFYATRGLRNPLNSNREVKVARDGTELEAGIGARILQLFGGSGVVHSLWP